MESGRILASKGPPRGPGTRGCSSPRMEWARAASGCLVPGPFLVPMADGRSWGVKVLF